MHMLRQLHHKNTRQNYYGENHPLSGLVLIFSSFVGELINIQTVHH